MSNRRKPNDVSDLHARIHEAIFGEADRYTDMIYPNQGQSNQTHSENNSHLGHYTGGGGQPYPTYNENNSGQWHYTGGWGQPENNSNWQHYTGRGVGQSSRGSFDTQLSSDEALARQLQEREGGFENMSIYDSHGSWTGNRGASYGGNSNLAGHQDDVDPDNMTYQQMSQLGQTVGSVSKGLSKEQISMLPTHKYTGSSKKKGTSEDNNTECAICKADYSGEDMLITLPCMHQYHSACIEYWFEENKTCCICKIEVAI